MNIRMYREQETAHPVAHQSMKAERQKNSPPKQKRMSKYVKSRPSSDRGVFSPKGVLVIGAGVAGIHTALDLANSQFRVYLVEREPIIGGRMVQLHKIFTSMDCTG